jgi:hypothetical protein
MTSHKHGVAGVDYCYCTPGELEQARKDAAAAKKMRAAAQEPCREWVEKKANRCNAPSDFILWGKLFPPEALGPRCYDHAYIHIGYGGISQIDQWAVFDLRPFAALGGDPE